MGKQILADIRLYPDAEDMSKIGHDKIQHAAQHIAQQHCDHNNKECPVHLVGQHIVQCAPGYQRKRQINAGYGHSAQNIHKEQSLVILKIAQEDQKRTFLLKILIRHTLPSNLCLYYTLFCLQLQGRNCKFGTDVL